MNDPEFKAAYLSHAIDKYPEEALKALDRGEYEDNMVDFVEGAWKYIDPNPYQYGWHLEAIAEHLQAVARGEIRRLVINVPPRTSKSSMVSVCFPAWVWSQSKTGPLSGPHVQFLFASYAQTLSIRDSVKTRRLLESPWYRTYWGNRFRITSDQNTKVRFDNDKGGYRLATSVDGALTGEGGSIIIVDDPHNANEVESDLVRQGTLEWWDQSMSTRLNDPKTGAYIVIMQRLHEEDLTGHVLSKDIGNWVHLCLPMRMETDRRCITPWFVDEREEGELLVPERFGDEQVSGAEGIAKNVFPPFEYVIGSLDTAYTTKQENDFSAMTIWGVWTDRQENRRIMLVYAWQDRLEFPQLVKKVLESSNKFRILSLIHI